MIVSFLFSFTISTADDFLFVSGENSHHLAEQNRPFLLKETHCLECIEIQKNFKLEIAKIPQTLFLHHSEDNLSLNKFDSLNNIFTTIKNSIKTAPNLCEVENTKPIIINVNFVPFIKTSTNNNNNNNKIILDSSVHSFIKVDSMNERITVYLYINSNSIPESLNNIEKSDFFKEIYGNVVEIIKNKESSINDNKTNPKCGFVNNFDILINGSSLCMLSSEPEKFELNCYTRNSLFISFKGMFKKCTKEGQKFRFLGNNEIYTCPDPQEYCSNLSLNENLFKESQTVLFFSCTALVLLTLVASLCGCIYCRKEKTKQDKNNVLGGTLLYN